MEKVKFKIGEIEFEAEGSADVIERERKTFMENILPLAVEAVVRTRGVTLTSVQQELPKEIPVALLENNQASVVENESANTIIPKDFSRMSLANFIKNFGHVSDQDFVLLSAYYFEKRDGIRIFDIESVKEYYDVARRSKYSNNSALLLELAKKGLIMDSPESEKKTPKQYILTGEGIEYIENLTPNFDELKHKPAKSKKTKSKVQSKYISLNIDNLHLNKYPEIKSFKNFKEQMMLILYIVTKENMGDSFSVSDIQCLMTDLMGLPATEKQIRGVIDRNKQWFKAENDEKNKKAFAYKLLQGGKDFAESIINSKANW